jgi:hypothetical protein
MIGSITTLPGRNPLEIFFIPDVNHFICIPSHVLKLGQLSYNTNNTVLCIAENFFFQPASTLLPLWACYLNALLVGPVAATWTSRSSRGFPLC